MSSVGLYGGQRSSCSAAIGTCVSPCMEEEVAAMKALDIRKELKVGGGALLHCLLIVH